MEITKGRKTKGTGQYTNETSATEALFGPQEASIPERVVTGVKTEGEQSWEQSLRPQNFDEFPGQHRVKEKLKVFVEAAKTRNEAIDHILLSGPPGLGKTTLATIIANAMEVDIKTTSGPALDKKGELAAILTGLKANSVLFIDEIHRLNTVVEEYLYSAMEDFYIDIVTGDGLGSRSMKFQLAPFTLVGATTRSGLLNAPFRDRFGIVERLNFYDRKSLQQILERDAKILNITISSEGAEEIARRSRGTPRVAIRLLKRVRDFAQVQSNGTIDQTLANSALNLLGVDRFGLDMMDRRILTMIHEKYAGGPVGIDTIAAAMGEERDTIEEVYEPFLLQEGFLQKTPRGRMITDYAKNHIFESGAEV
ncbi:MAG: Holliday junction branch migration DNA helicase RuvB [Proteobacteria bacterium]|nr:MAG: Holliday junction branch migration DNA helicase RuvB [Pseudomonadota bacterium]